ncbi:MAG: alpha/beta fold hydrolase, partial [Planctomycetota bacterium]
EHATGDAERLIDDVERLLDDPALVSPPVVLLGVSWGAKLATAVAVRRPVAGLAWVNPGLFSRFTPSAPARLAVRLLPGSLEVPIPLNDPALFTDDPARRAMIAADPHARRTADMTLLRATAELDRRLAARSDRLDTPLLVQLAGQDQIVDNRRTRDRAETLAADVTVREYADARHTLEFSAAADDAAADLVAWLGRLRADARGPDGRGSRDDRPQ